MYFTHLIISGGFVMIPLFILLVLSIFIGIKKFWEYKKEDFNEEQLAMDITNYLLENKTTDLKDYLNRDNRAINKIIFSGASHLNMPLKQRDLIAASANLYASRLKDKLNYLSSIVTLAPLLGLLGTVFGMIDSFKVFNVNSNDPLNITGGIAEALIATATGLIVAITALVLHTYLNKYMQNLTRKIEYVSQTYLSIVEGKNDYQR